MCHVGGLIHFSMTDLRTTVAMTVADVSTLDLAAAQSFLSLLACTLELEYLK